MLDFFRNLNIKTKIMSVFTLFVFVLLFLGYKNYNSLTGASERSAEIYNDRLVPIHDLGEVAFLMMSVRGDLRHYLLTATDEKRSKIQSGIISKCTKIDETFLKYTQTKLEKSEEENIPIFKEYWSKYKVEKDQVINLANTNSTEEAFVYLNGDGVADFNKASETIQVLIDINIKRAEELKTEIDVEGSVSKSQSIYLIIFSSIVALILGFYLSTSIGKPLKKLSETANKIADGNFDLEVETLNTKEEVGKLTVSVKNMLAKIRSAMNEAQQKSEEANRAVQESNSVKNSIEKQQLYLSESTQKMIVQMDKFAEGDLSVSLPVEKDDEIGRLFNGFNKSVSNIGKLITSVKEAVAATASAANQISSSTEQMAAGAQEQSSQATEVAGAVEEMTKTIYETTKNTGQATEASKNSGRVAKEGGHVVEETINGMNRIAEVVKKSAETVQALGKSSDQIGEIVQVIDDIADQTNLLALNAAIEAARAGEQGRGFAVVADEVRKLAERTTKATKEIATMIKQIQKDTTGAVESMEEGTKEVEVGKQLAEKAGSSLKEIIHGAEQVLDIVSQVAAASEEQSSAAEQISKNIESISSVTQESASGIQQIAHASEDLNRLTLNLQELIAQFKVDETGSGNLAVRKNGKLVHV